MTSKQTKNNSTWYSLNKDQFLVNKKYDYQTFYKYYYKIRVLLKKYPQVEIPNSILNMVITNKNEDYKIKFVLIKEIIDKYIINNIKQNIAEPTNGTTRRTYKKQILTN